jgi:hypothetical protein
MKTNTADTIKCLICHKPVKGNANFVQMAVDGRLWTERNAPVLDEANDQGAFEVGSDCYRKVSAAGAAGYRMSAR